ncbi:MULTISPECIES: FTR1 family iron permease [Bifidobacterium]|jgi:high-affinity iron transporter|uniref:High-affinity Fe2 /Pb2 permease n=1 Tax=Bifidobacterium psychraerophilum TaxID=218140 RepID=A0A087CI20_9BIFI|nr:FTR1 family protein [Bifidobacterium psychraerophilum]KFI82920.1 high-affinity Fe2 /Pb2 permease [Bifidobacterium psychraerophilum]PKA94668.1 high-affinity iron transporter [Bifidobacterium psychraerophilum DSM 22366]
MQSRIFKTVRRPVALFALLVAFIAMSSLCLPQASAADADGGDYSSWSEIATTTNAQLAKAEESYAGGDTAGASSKFSAAYNSVYVASNFAKVVNDTLGANSQQSLQQQFQAIEQLSYTTGNTEAISSKLSALQTDLLASARQLDQEANLSNPKVYAENLNKQIEEQRKKLDAAKKNKNTGRGDQSWSEVADQMTALLDKASKASAAGDGRQGSDLVNEAYYQYYEKLGFEKTVMNAISGRRVSQVEYQFKETRMAMVQGESDSKVQGLVDDLKTMIVEDAKTLDGGAAGDVNPMTAFFTSAFGQAFVVLLREGLEALLVVAAIIAYLVKAGHGNKVRYIYWGVVAGLIGSALMALLFTFVFNSAGAHQEMLEGITALIAMVMLLYTSNWMLSKSSVDSWNSYIKEKTVAAVSTGSVVSLALLSFLAVFREGAETVMFYQAIFTMAPSGSREIWMGFAAAAVVLVLLFLLIRFTSVKIPIRPFFMITSALMAVMVVIFAGGGVHALIEGDIVPATYLPAVPTNDWIGLYPYAQTVAAQIIALVVVVLLFVVSVFRQRRVHAAAVAGAQAVDAGAAADTAHHGDADAK